MQQQLPPRAVLQFVGVEAFPTAPQRHPVRRQTSPGSSFAATNDRACDCDRKSLPLAPEAFALHCVAERTCHMRSANHCHYRLSDCMWAKVPSDSFGVAPRRLQAKHALIHTANSGTTAQAATKWSCRPPLLHTPEQGPQLHR